jgi:hypothetical protein
MKKEQQKISHSPITASTQNNINCFKHDKHNNRLEKACSREDAALQKGG